ncbi:N-acetyltransferase domain-containing protein [Mycena indigotica]|uniref:N-acetyltransferase domain-containing protein n=1 Tax=Mycena indigotica TaxID=2126181 RepID=A0A8H6WCC4_9AGAR|nr:N-acetyltransferase domain-containing protein [Mycena indigotica]KAF7307209.1 N-acetyltransferase domain-containing protein [Mycena indigotica]
MTFTHSLPGEEAPIVLQHLSAVEFLSVAYPTLRRHEESANIVLAHALSRSPAEYVLTECNFVREDSLRLMTKKAPPIVAENFWLTVWHTSGTTPVLDGIIACLSSSTGQYYPLFLWGSTLPSAVVAFLRGCIDPRRVFAIFGPTNLADSFSHSWTALTGFRIREEPLYDAFFAVCSPQSLLRAQSPKAVTAQRIRKAACRDVEAVADLCEGFYSSSEYPVDFTQAKHEAEELVRKGLAWIYETQAGEITTLCAVTRTSLRVAAITKVYTRPECRKHGFAQDLVHEVAHRLFECGKQGVVLYVGKGNKARNVYERVGFKVEDGEGWKEIGFVGTLHGHW